MLIEFHKLSAKITAAGVQPGLIHLLVSSLVGGEVATQSSLLKVAPCILDPLATLLQSIAGGSLQRHCIEWRPLVVVEFITCTSCLTSPLVLLNKKITTLEGMTLLEK